MKVMEEKYEPNNDTKKIKEINRFCVLLFLLRNEEIRERDKIRRTTEHIILETTMNEKADSKKYQEKRKLGIGKSVTLEGTPSSRSYEF